MNPQEEKELLALLLRTKTQEEIKELQKNLLINKLASLLHTLLCPLDHEKNCDFYTEEQQVVVSVARGNWITRTKRLLLNANVREAADISLIMKMLPTIIPLIATYPPVIRFLSFILEPLLEYATATQAVQLEASSSSPPDPSSSASLQKE